MNEKTPVPPSRGRFHGVWQIIRFNWTQYAGALATILLAVGWLVLGDGPAWLWFAALLTAILATTLIFTSLFASYWTYDLSDLYRWTWIVEVQPTPPHRWLNLHAGLDESSTALLRAFPSSEGTTADFFDPNEMSEPSILRARKERIGAGASQPISYHAMPFADSWFDTVFVFFAAHELRRNASRELFFRELGRVTKPSGTVLLVEHARDWANFIAFGPGCLHFFPLHEWKRLASVAGFTIQLERRMTPFVCVLLLRRKT